MRARSGETTQDGQFRGRAGAGIVHVIAGLDNPTAGPSYSVAGLVRAQARLGADVSICSAGGSADPACPYPDLRFPIDFAGWPLVGRLRFSAPLRRALVGTRWSIVHDHGLWLMPNIYAARAAHAQGAKFVVAPRGMLSPVALGFSAMRKALFGLAFQRRALARVDMFHATSEAEAEEIRALGHRQPVCVVPNGVALPDEALLASAPKSGRTVVSLGRIHPKKGLDRLLRAWGLIEDRHPGWRLLVVGPDEGGHAAELRALSRKLGLARVELRGPALGEDKVRLLASSDLFVLPSLNENFAMTVAESLSAGTPVISTRGAPWADLDTQGCGWWIEHGVDALAAALSSALDLPASARTAMGRRGRAWMEADFSEDAMARRMLAAYGWLWGERERPDWVLPAAGATASVGRAA